MAGTTKLMTAGGGGVSLTPASSIASDVTVNVPSQNCTLGIQGPAFSAYMSSNASFTSGTTTKVILDTEVFDTASCFASSRFTPNIAGYYQINGKIRVTGTGCTAIANIYKNGTSLINGSYLTGTGSVVFSVVSTVVYMNGSTDYIELYGYGDATSGNPTFQYISVGNTCEMTGCLVRAA